ncbi:xanthine dehydrogenase family protein molybdopterin-binding subunit [Burkholderia sp. Ax-1719]|uniref:xanthine dehydrogenase family protein molybdopterin-binding subunit n=1 Tax=Burkholderia sp. Ax-1719 TaxID=2608334 RepID=UPI001421A490|nr:xanthine dehydrogenase family protein molybdopterin-binding subunit [Burkholderia sp. Ax-1719]NIE67200.1 xanthine dehydrogenase family protein molybdopterin-binding subunit [Burkholderia sp. Ax-1719]
MRDPKLTDDGARATISRRQFLAGMSALTLAVGFRGGLAVAATLDPAKNATQFSFEPNAFIRVDASGAVTVIAEYLEMGQGTFTGLATLAADELDVPLDKVSVEAAPADVKKYANPMFAAFGWTLQATGGSTAMAGAWKQMREAAAAARVMLVSAAAKQWKVDPATLHVEDGVIVHAASGRRAGYGQFVAAAAREPVPANVAVKQPADFKLIGKRDTKRVDIPAKVNGSAIYTQDMKLPGMLVAVIAHPPRLGGKVRHIDASKAKAIRGVVAVVQIPGDDEVQGGVAVLAQNTWIARQGRDALNITWDDSHAFALSSTDIFSQFRTLADQPGNVAEQRGKVLTAAPEGGKYIEAVYEQPYLAHAPMEPMNCLIQFQGDRCEIWNGEQWHTADQAMAAKELGLKPEQVTIHQLYAGGSFGRRANPHSDFVREAARVARAAHAQGVTAPVKLVWMREDDMRAGYYRPLTVHKVRVAVDKAGALVSWNHDVVGQSFMQLPKPDSIDPVLVEGAADIPYAIPNFRVAQHKAKLPVQTQWMRSVGHTHSAFVGETMMDEAARAAGKDPYAFRHALLGKMPRHRGVLELVAQKSGWSTPLKPGPQGTRRGRGIALQLAFGTYVAQVAEVTVQPDGAFTVDRVVCAVDCGMVVNPDIVATQVEGGIGFGLTFLRTAITFDKGHVRQGNFNDYPVLRMSGMPVVEVHIVPSKEAPTGIGEPGVPPAAPAVANALAAATGATIRSLPLGDSLRPA